MSASAHPGLKYAKGRPAKLERTDRRADLERRDRLESAKARRRANGQCEVQVLTETPHVKTRCPRRDVHTHHQLGGIGRRLTEKSIQASRKQRVCAVCHSDITNNVLHRIGGTDPHFLDPYWRST